MLLLQMTGERRRRSGKRVLNTERVSAKKQSRILDCEFQIEMMYFDFAAGSTSARAILFWQLTNAWLR
ncbi:hypothetical protein AOQ73_20960 [Bradyrhizobium pachyrhizi]|nr:hypothetical protein AOQ73_20960 [Bradyrhizobium pachyrhizi]